MNGHYVPPHIKPVPPVGMEYPEGVLPRESDCVPGTKPSRPLTYLACPYSHPNKNMMAVRYVKSTEATAWLIMKMGWNVFSPITHSHPLATLGGLRGDWPFWEKIDRQYLEVSERLVVLELEGWRTSVGVQAEIEIARQLGVPVSYMRPDAHGGFDLAPYPMDEVGSFGLHRHPPVPTIEEKICEQIRDQLERSLPELDVWPTTRKPTSKADTTNPKDLVGATKVSLSKVPSVAIAHCAHAMMDGARKYDPYNWRAKAVQASIYVDAALRHIMDWFEGEESAPDSKVHHLGHAMACCAILLDCQETGNLIDDRPVTEKSKGVMTRVLTELRKKIAAMPPIERSKL